MDRLKFYINGIETDIKPLNHDQLQVRIDWTGERGVFIEFDDLVWRDEANGTTVSNLLSLRSSLGFGVGVPFNIRVYNSEQTSYVELPDMMLDFRRFRQIGCNEIQVGVQMVQQKDWLSSVASPVQFKRLEENGFIDSSDFIQIPYNINYIPDFLQTAMLAYATYNLAKTTYEFVKESASTVAELTTAPIPAVGVGAVTVVGNILQVALMIAIRIIYFIGLAIALKNLFTALLEQIYSPTRYHTGCHERTLFEKGLEYLGLNFQSSIYTIGTDPYNAVIMPSKTERGKKNINIQNGGTPSRNDGGVYFLGEFITTMMDKYNADYRIQNGTFYFERWDYWQNNSSVTLDDNYSDQTRLLNVTGDNSNEFNAGYFISFAIDQSDRNTLDNWDGTCYDIITENAANPNGDKYNLISGNKVVDIPLALGTRKDVLNNFEKALKKVFKLVDSVTGLFGNGTNLEAQILNRTGNLVLSDHFTTVPKNLIMESGQLAANQRDLLSAVVLWDNYHFINSFKPINGKHNQWLKNNVPMKFCSDKFNTFIFSNFAKLSSGQDVEIENITWTMEEDYAEVNYRRNEQYNFNLKQTFITGNNTQYAQYPNV